ncbi:hypothetical protein TIFTF001_027731 [Ficus carica]|uniref:Uncharacterized protein n=1 Tax=Ficus carica TaxID=3494 RepID=A0AA88DNH6_FICCA|nr:hypothetical protein TIFTF001_027731 [Ficus carica]
MASSRSDEWGTWVARLWLLERRSPPSSSKILMLKIFGTTPDVIAWCDRSCTVTLRRVTCEKEAPGSDGDTSGVSAMGTLMLKSVRTLSAGSGDPIGLNSKCSRRIDMLQPRSEEATNIGNGIGAATSGASGIRGRIECCDRAPPSARMRRCNADSEGPTGLGAPKSCPESSAGANGTDPSRDLSRVHGAYQQW